MRWQLIAVNCITLVCSAFGRDELTIKILQSFFATHAGSVATTAGNFFFVYFFFTIIFLPSILNATSSDAVIYNELKKVFGQAIAQLTPQQKKVYELGKLEGKKYDEIAGILHISKETVKNHMSEALKSIKSFLLKHEGLLAWLVLLLTANRN